MGRQMNLPKNSKHALSFNSNSGNKLEKYLQGLADTEIKVQFSTLY